MNAPQESKKNALTTKLPAGQGTTVSSAAEAPRAGDAGPAARATERTHFWH